MASESEALGRGELTDLAQDGTTTLDCDSLLSKAGLPIIT